MRRSNSWSESYEDFAVAEENSAEPTESSQESHKDRHRDQICLLETSSGFDCETFKRIYANILLQFGLHKQRVQLMKYIESTMPQPHVGLDVSPLCCRCHKEIPRGKDRLRCPSCRCFTLKCVICRMSVKGVYSVCLQCQHGGHLSHITDWFTSHYECPTGCGCRCVILQQRSLSSSAAAATTTMNVVEPYIQLTLT